MAAKTVGGRGRRGSPGGRGKQPPQVKALGHLDTLDILDDPLSGAHVSSAGGTPNAPPRAKAIGATAMQIFSKMANRWAERVCEDDECVAFKAALADTNVTVTIAHDSYLINLASPDAFLRARSTD